MGFKNKELVENNKLKTKDVEVGFIIKETKWRAILYLIDTLLIALSFLFLSLGSSAFVNSFICRKFDNQKDDMILFFETTGESIVIIFLIFILIFYIPKIPSIVPFPDNNHIRFRILCRHAVVGASVVFAHERLFKKYQYFLGIDQK